MSEKELIIEALEDYRKNRLTAHGMLVIVAGLVLPQSLTPDDLKWAEEQIHSMQSADKEAEGRE